MNSINYSNQAKIDIEDTISHIASQSRTNAMSYLSRYEDKIELLRLNPYMGVECKNKLIKRDCRVLVHESHIIIYKIMQDQILLIRIFHGSVNYVDKINKQPNKNNK